MLSVSTFVAERAGQTFNRMPTRVRRRAMDFGPEYEVQRPEYAVLEFGLGFMFDSGAFVSAAWTERLSGPSACSRTIFPLGIDWTPSGDDPTVRQMGGARLAGASHAPDIIIPRTVLVAWQGTVQMDDTVTHDMHRTRSRGMAWRRLCGKRTRKGTLSNDHYPQREEIFYEPRTRVSLGRLGLGTCYYGERLHEMGLYGVTEREKGRI
ncbi:hypothetical protein N7462_000047 [Penicillium macrosclerotiorum]|uniref:uncharacterized protein n=1 Tax=Penicillium macrosclerotiorum TaxID=303699 RepID=UPI0025475224|nr:uncharacterized protein N7462_000047 [Penicillium macrosclerotiorum]KAJ5698042.1 hypothetical protein N7462_000047 [Penicillium macrosclerotiorum]